MNILSADVGGTKTLLQLSYLDVDRGVRKVRQQRFETPRYTKFEFLLREFVEASTDVLSACCFAVAGPVIDGKAQLTNVPWAISEVELSEFLGSRATLVNDFYAAAAAAAHLEPEDVLAVNLGDRDPRAPVAVLGAGTGLGEAFLIPTERGMRVIATEGGHTDFAPSGEVQRDLLEELTRRFGHVSYERILSGAGLVDVYRFFAVRAATVPVASSAADIINASRQGDDVARRAVELFIEVYGAEAGNFALKTLARGGVFIAGGIAARHPDLFTDGRFFRAFASKGRFEPLLRTIPVSVIVAEEIALRGATALAAEMVVRRR